MKRLALLLLALVWLLVPITGWATPYYTIESAGKCDTCHVEPVGWLNPEDTRDRRCTLDCSGCHVSPTGGGMRTPLGDFYAQEVLNQWGVHPSERVDLSAYELEGYPREGRYSLFGGFEGWWPGPWSHREIDERYGHIDPSPTFQVGMDYRMMNIVDADDGETNTFPMEAQVYLASHPTSNLTTYLDIGYQGSASEREFDSFGDAVQNRLWIREVFAMLHDLPFGSWVRVGRFNLPYGWRIPDHSAFFRAGMFDQYRQGYGVEGGIAANEAWLNVAMTYQGFEAWPGEGLAGLAQGMNLTAQGGFRRLGGTFGPTLNYFKSSDTSVASDALMAGLMGALNLSPVSWTTEVDWRYESTGGPDGEGASSLFAYHEFRVAAVEGFTPKVRYEWMDSNVLYRDDHAHRAIIGAEWNPYRGIQLDVMFRREMRPGFEANNLLLSQLHLHF